MADGITTTVTADVGHSGAVCGVVVGRGVVVPPYRVVGTRAVVCSLCGGHEGGGGDRLLPDGMKYRRGSGARFSAGFGGGGGQTRFE
jgi:hypothetical protein